MDRLFKEIQNNTHKGTNTATMILALVSLPLTGLGILKMGSDDSDPILALLAFVVAGGGAVFMHRSWLMAYAATKAYHTYAGLIFSLFAAILNLFVIFGYSTAFSVAFTAGDAAEKFAVKDRVAITATVTDHVNRNIQSFRQFIYDLRSEQKRYAVLARNERSGATSGGLSGKGTIYYTLQSVSDRLGTLADLLEARLSDIDGQMEIAKNHIQTMRDIEGKGELSVNARIRLMGAPYDNLRQVLVSMEQMNPLGVLDRGLKSLIDETDSRQLDARTERGRRAQHQALATIKRDLERLHNRITGSFATSEGATLAPLEPINAISAVVSGWKRLIPYIGLAVALDAAPFLIFLYLWTAAVIRLEVDGPPATGTDATIWEAIKIIKGVNRLEIENLTGGAPSPQSDNHSSSNTQNGAHSHHGGTS